jgi:excisionase family DNA binding protein
MRLNSGKMTDDPWLTVAEVARIPRLSKMTIYRAVWNGHLDAVRLGRSIRVRESAVIAWIRNGSVAGREQ